MRLKRSAPWRLRALRQLKLDGRVDKGGTITGKMMVESRPPIQGADPVSGMPRIEFEYCFAGRDYTLKKG